MTLYNVIFFCFNVNTSLKNPYQKTKLSKSPYKHRKSIHPSKALTKNHNPFITLHLTILTPTQTHFTIPQNKHLIFVYYSKKAS